MTPAREIVLHRTSTSSRYPWRECNCDKTAPCGPVDYEHLVVVPKDALREVRVEVFKEAHGFLHSVHDEDFTVSDCPEDSCENARASRKREAEETERRERAELGRLKEKYKDS